MSCSKEAGCKRGLEADGVNDENTPPVKRQTLTERRTVLQHSGLQGQGDFMATLDAVPKGLRRTVMIAEGASMGSRMRQRKPEQCIVCGILGPLLVCVRFSDNAAILLTPADLTDEVVVVSKASSHLLTVRMEVGRGWVLRSPLDIARCAFHFHLETASEQYRRLIVGDALERHRTVHDALVSMFCNYPSRSKDALLHAGFGTACLHHCILNYLLDIYLADGDSTTASAPPPALVLPYLCLTGRVAGSVRVMEAGIQQFATEVRGAADTGLLTLPSLCDTAERAARFHHREFCEEVLTNIERVMALQQDPLLPCIRDLDGASELSLEELVARAAHHVPIARELWNEAP